MRRCEKAKAGGQSNSVNDKLEAISVTDFVLAPAKQYDGRFAEAFAVFVFCMKGHGALGGCRICPEGIFRQCEKLEGDVNLIGDTVN